VLADAFPRRAQGLRILGRVERFGGGCAHLHLKGAFALLLLLQRVALVHQPIYRLDDALLFFEGRKRIRLELKFRVLQAPYRRPCFYKLIEDVRLEAFEDESDIPGHPRYKRR